MFDLGSVAIGDVSVDDVWARFGTSADQPGFDLVIIPVPPAAFMVVAGLGATLVARRRLARG